MKINNLELPAELVQFLTSENSVYWREGADFSKVSSSPYAREIKFLQADEIISLTSELLDISKLPESEYYGLSKMGMNDDLQGLLIVSKAVAIASNNDEDVICLDYSIDKNSPRVMTNTFDEGPYRWYEIAPDFNALLSKVF